MFEWTKETASVHILLGPYVCVFVSTTCSETNKIKGFVLWKDLLRISLCFDVERETTPLPDGLRQYIFTLPFAYLHKRCRPASIDCVRYTRQRNAHAFEIKRNNRFPHTHRTMVSSARISVFVEFRTLFFYFFYCAFIWLFSICCWGAKR